MLNRRLEKRQSRLLLVVAMTFCGLYLHSIFVSSELQPDKWQFVDIQNGSDQRDKYVPRKSLTELEEEQTRRRSLLEEMCEASGYNPTLDAVLQHKRVLDHFIVDDEHKLLYCSVPKAASTTWKRLLMVINGKANTTDLSSIFGHEAHRKHLFRRLDEYTSEEIAYKLEHYVKFLFVRHPFERVVSAYLDKFSQNHSISDYFHERFGRDIVRKYRANATEESLLGGHDVTFREFVQYITDPNTTRKYVFNEHWRPMVELCLPCTVQYNVIGKHETVMDDAWLVLKKANLNELVSFPPRGHSPNREKIVNKYFSQISFQERKALYRVYERDFRLFGYIPSVVYNASDVK